MSRTTLVVGDVHGCADELRDLLDRVGPDRVVLVGDLFTKGPDPVGVWRVVRGLEAVLGNHDDKLLQRRKSVQHVIDALEKEDWAWRPWVQSLPLMMEAGRYVVVHAGIHPSGDRALTTREMALTMRRWPDERPDNPFWWQVYQGRQPVLFGHDARRGHVRVDAPDGSPHIVGLDTGCVYGGQLSGWVVEEERLVQVSAREAYVPLDD